MDNFWESGHEQIFDDNGHIGINGEKWIIDVKIKNCTVFILYMVTDGFPWEIWCCDAY